MARKKEKIIIEKNVKFFTGIGSRKTPNNILNLIERIAEKLYNLEWTLRSGGAAGPDAEFERVYHTRFTTIRDLERRKFVTQELYEIYYSNQRFKNSFGTYAIDQELWDKAAILAEQFHPNWAACSPKARNLHTRNGFQILGQDLETPSKFVICYTPGGQMIGGTSQALRLALHYEVPIFNLGKTEDLQRLSKFVMDLRSEDEQDNSGISSGEILV